MSVPTLRGIERGPNSLGALRAVLACAVIVSHAWPLSGRGPDPVLGDLTVGQWAVAAFFVVSGYLITGSRMCETSTMRYFWRRSLRIFPGYWVVLLLTALVAAPLALELTERSGSAVWLGPDNALRYFAANYALVRAQTTVAGTPGEVPFPGDWNGSTWSLFFEFACYVVVGLLGASPAVRGRRWPVLLTAVTFLVLNIGNHTVLPSQGNYVADRFLDYGLMFFCGATLWVLADRVPLSAALAGSSAAVLVAVGAFDATMVLGGLPLAYLCLWLSAVLPLRRIGVRNDLSYGLYLYAFPVQQLLALLRVQDHGFLLYVTMSFVGTVPLAYASWRMVEQPALRLKAWQPTRRLGAVRTPLQLR